jgi:hypothetical protein
MLTLLHPVAATLLSQKEIGIVRERAQSRLHFWMTKQLTLGVCTVALNEFDCFFFYSG